MTSKRTRSAGLERRKMMKIVIDTGYYPPEEIKDALYSLLNTASDISVAHYLRIMQIIKSMEDRV